MFLDSFNADWDRLIKMIAFFSSGSSYFEIRWICISSYVPALTFLSWALTDGKKQSWTQVAEMGSRP